MDIDLLRKRKKELKLTSREISDLSGIPLGTVQKVFSGATRSPRNDTLEALAKVLLVKERTPAQPHPADAGEGFVYPMPGEDRKAASEVRESGYTYGTSAGKLQTEAGDETGGKAPGGYTYADYLALPDERRVELIDGEFFDMAAPSSGHQIIIGELFSMFRECAHSHPECIVMLSPLDVILDMDDRTVVQPDLVVLCDRSKMRRRGIFGAPDLIVEVISPSSGKLDYGLKAYKYFNAGVREYWIVDYARRTVIVYVIEAGENPVPTLYPMNTEDAKIPVHISGGKCSIDIGKMWDLLDGLGDI